MKTKVIILISIIILDIILLSVFTVSYAIGNENDLKNTVENKITTEEIITTTTSKINITKINVNAVGDCTIGYDDNYGYTNSFNEYLEKNGYDYFFSNVKSIFKSDDITIANLEGTFTDATIKRPKQYNFKGPKDYVNVFNGSSVEVVNLANNHTYDYNEVGYLDTINTLESNNIKYFGFDNYYIYEKENIKVGFSGILCIESTGCTKDIDDAINYFNNNNVDTVVMTFHWGVENTYKQSYSQTYLAHYAIDNGVELVLGHHPHVLQGIELYKDKYIVYSLGNFSFGGHMNPSDKDTMIFNFEFIYEDKKLNDTIIRIYPTSVSSVSYRNDYRPTLLVNEEYDRVMKKINDLSIGINLI